MYGIENIVHHQVQLIRKNVSFRRGNCYLQRLCGRIVASKLGDNVNIRKSVRIDAHTDRRADEGKGITVFDERGCNAELACLRVISDPFRVPLAGSRNGILNIVDTQDKELRHGEAFVGTDIDHKRFIIRPCEGSSGGGRFRQSSVLGRSRVGSPIFGNGDRFFRRNDSISRCCVIGRCRNGKHRKSQNQRKRGIKVFFTHVFSSPWMRRFRKLYPGQNRSRLPSRRRLLRNMW